jgi:hypothetical protein
MGKLLSDEEVAALLKSATTDSKRNESPLSFPNDDLGKQREMYALQLQMRDVNNAVSKLMLEQDELKKERNELKRCLEKTAQAMLDAHLIINAALEALPVDTLREL